MGTRCPYPNPHLGPSLCFPHNHQLGLAGLLGLTLTLGQPPRGPSQGAWCCKAGDWGPPSPSARLTLWPGHNMHPSVRRRSIRVGNGQGPPTPRRHSMAPAPKPLGPRSPWPAPSPRSAQPLSTQLSVWVSRLLGANPNHGSALEGPFPRGLVPQCRGLGTPEPQRQTHPASTLTARPIGVPPLIQGGRTGRALRTQVTFKSTSH